MLSQLLTAVGVLALLAGTWRITARPHRRGQRGRRT